jgi:hypothetical protein
LDFPDADQHAFADQPSRLTEEDIKSLGGVSLNYNRSEKKYKSERIESASIKIGDLVAFRNNKSGLRYLKESNVENCFQVTNIEDGPEPGSRMLTVLSKTNKDIAFRFRAYFFKKLEV